MGEGGALSVVAAAAGVGFSAVAAFSGLIVGVMRLWRVVVAGMGRRRRGGFLSASLLGVLVCPDVRISLCGSELVILNSIYQIGLHHDIFNIKIVIICHTITLFPLLSRL